MTKSVDAPRVLAYCHDGVGLGHVRRTHNICAHLGAIHEQATFLVATGSPYLSLFQSSPHMDYLKLPSISKLDNERYTPKFLTLASKQVLSYRETLLLETARHFRPHLVLIDKAPIGVCGELATTIQWIRENAPETRIVFGMRDIEDEPAATIRQWSRLGVQRMLEDYFDEIWVYGMRGLFDVASEYKLSATIAGKLRFMGYVTGGTCGHAAATRNGSETARPKRVLVTVGGGTDGTALLEAYVAEAAVRAAASGVESSIVAGPDFPADSAESLKKAVASIPNVEWFDFVPCMNCLINESDLVVCMGGYNTLCEVARNGKPVLVVPRVRPRLEQAIRADLWAKRGIVNVLRAACMTPTTLADRVLELLDGDSPSTPVDLDLRGLEGIGKQFGALLNGGIGHAAAVRL